MNLNINMHVYFHNVIFLFVLSIIVVSFALPHTIINVHDYGAIADDTIDDTRQIQHAIEAGWSSFDLFFPGGMYYLSGPIVIKDMQPGCTIKGAHAVLEMRNGDAPNMIIEKGSSGVTIDGFVFRNTTSNHGTGVQVATQYITIQHCYFQGISTGIRCTRDYKNNSAAMFCLFSQNHFKGNDTGMIFNGGCNANSIELCKFYKTRDCAIAFVALGKGMDSIPSENLITRCFFEGSTNAKAIIDDGGTHNGVQFSRWDNWKDSIIARRSTINQSIGFYTLGNRDVDGNGKYQGGYYSNGVGDYQIAAFSETHLENDVEITSDSAYKEIIQLRDTIMVKSLNKPLFSKITAQVQFRIPDGPAWFKLQASTLQGKVLACTEVQAHSVSDSTFIHTASLTLALPVKTETSGIIVVTIKAKKSGNGGTIIVLGKVQDMFRTQISTIALPDGIMY
jgi:hypothetical protein